MRNTREPATESDARNGSVIFYVADSRSKAFDLGVDLPVPAVLLKDTGEKQPIPAGTQIQLVQAEILDGSHVLLGFTCGDGEGICTLDDIAIESNEADKPNSAPDVRNLAFQLLEEAKRDLQKDKYLNPIAFIITSNNAIRVPLSFQGVQQKHAAYSRLIQLAKAHRALAIITVNDAHLSRESDDDDGYYDGKLAATKSPEAIWVTVSGPAIINWSITAPYKRTGDQIVLSPDKESLGGELNLLAVWSSNEGLPKN